MVFWPSFVDLVISVLGLYGNILLFISTFLHFLSCLKCSDCDYKLNLDTTKL